MAGFVAEAAAVALAGADLARESTGPRVSSGVAVAMASAAGTNGAEEVEEDKEEEEKRELGCVFEAEAR